MRVSLVKVMISVLCRNDSVIDATAVNNSVLIPVVVLVTRNLCR